MTYEFEYLMYLLGAASRGTPPEPPTSALSWERVFTLAQEQQILPLIALACEENRRLGCPSELLQDCTKNLLSTILTNCARRGSIVALLEEMEQIGIHSFMVKGMVAAANYAAPEYRISTDTDICINPSDEKRTCEWLEAHGFSISPRWRNGHHAVARHPQMGILEVHIRLYDEMPEEVWFKNADSAMLLVEQETQIITDDGRFYTLGATDHLIFMTLHMIKHFISCGMSLRMMMDVALHIAKNKDVLDTKRFWSVMDALHYVPLINSILWAMVRYCGFSPEDFPGLGSCHEEHIPGILTDVESGGWLGTNNKDERQKSGYDYNQELMLRQLSPWKYRLHMFKWRHGFSLRTFFPKRKQLIPYYPWLTRFPWLLPAAWMHRLILRGWTAFRKERAVDNVESDAQSVSRQRLELFRSLEML